MIQLLLLTMQSMQLVLSLQRKSQQHSQLLGQLHNHVWTGWSACSHEKKTPCRSEPTGTQLPTRSLYCQRQRQRRLHAKTDGHKRRLAPPHVGLRLHRRHSDTHSSQAKEKTEATPSISFGGM
ncbi:hypothetical protein MRB53_036251 [Persea americana]|nr:hypothetical protein MRB53_036642 [Persea americana]KAJ8614838.1 hypothetical protein MRB53_036251 [Persea americana]